MRIAIFSDTFLPDINGVSTFVRLSAKALSMRGHEVQVFTVSKISKKRLNEKIGKNKYKIITIPSVPALVYPNVRIGVPSGTMLPRLIKFRPDIIHSHTPFAMGWEAYLGAKILRIPLVGTHHTFYDHYLKHIKADFEAMKRFSWKYITGYYNRCDLITTPSMSLAKEMRENNLKESVEILPNFVNLKLFKPPTKSKKEQLKKILGIQDISLVYMGRLSYEKSIDQVLEAFAKVTQHYPRATLMIIGDGPEKENLKSLAKKLKISKKIIFTGFLAGKKLVNALQTNDIFVTASKTESFGIAIIEAMATRLPIIAVREKGPCEIVKNGVNGYLISAERPHLISEKILRLINSPDLLNEFSKNSYRLSKEYSADKIIRKLEKIYQKLI